MLLKSKPAGHVYTVHKGPDTYIFLFPDTNDSIQEALCRAERFGAMSDLSWSSCDSLAMAHILKPLIQEHEFMAFLGQRPEHFKEEPKLASERMEIEFENGMYISMESDEAYGMSNDKYDEIELWLPKSQVELINQNGKWVYAVELPIWLAEEKGLYE